MADILVGNGNLPDSTFVMEAAILAGLIDEDAPLDACKMRLYTNNFTPNRSSVTGSFTEATYTGYTAGGIVITWGTPGHGDDGVPEVVGSNCSFAASGTTVANTVYGYYVVDAAGLFLWGERFPETQIFAAAGDHLIVVPLYRLTPAP